VGLELTAAVAAQVDPLVEHITAELARWGIEAGRRPGAA